MAVRTLRPAPRQLRERQAHRAVSLEIRRLNPRVAFLEAEIHNRLLRPAPICFLGSADNKAVRPAAVCLALRRIQPRRSPSSLAVCSEGRRVEARPRHRRELLGGFLAVAVRRRLSRNLCLAGWEALLQPGGLYCKYRVIPFHKL